MDRPDRLSKDARRPNPYRRATFDLAESTSNVPSEEGTDKEQPSGGQTRIHFAENLDIQKRGIKRSSTYPFSSPEGRGATIEHETLPLQDGHVQSKVRAQSQREIPPFRIPFEPPRRRDTTFSTSTSYKGAANSSLRFMQSDDSDILSADDDSASDISASSSLAFDFSPMGPSAKIQEKPETVPEVVTESSTNKRSEMYNETIHKILISHYNSSTSRRSESTAKLLVDQPVETQENQSQPLMRWMYVLIPTKLQSSD